MTINCISCGHRIDLGEDYNSYKGPVKCWVCGALLDIKTEGGNLRAVKILSAPRYTAENAIEHSG
jgi:ribosomal protein S27E